ncbi:MAG TPA: hypothetical protein VGJ34_07090 [Gaiellaceae bacterium]|jgi:hypothetical protein
MRRFITGVLVVGLLGLGLAAVVDALRGEGRQTIEAGARTVGAAAAPVAALSATDARGTLTYSDEQCRLHALRLPGLRPVAAPPYRSCEPHIPSGGLGIWKGEVVWSGLGFQTIQVVLSRAELTAAIHGDPQAAQLAFGGAGAYEATQLVALGPDRYAVVLDHRRAPWERLLAVFAGRRLVDLRLGVIGPDDSIRPSSTGRYFALMRPQDVQVFQTDGGEVQLPSASLPHAIAWSPDDRWTALATRYSIYVFPSERSDETIRIPLAVRDLDWGP